MTEHRPAAAVRQPVVSRRIGWGGVARCVYCGRRSAPHLLACYRHADLVALDIRYAGLFERGKVPA